MMRNIFFHPGRCKLVMTPLVIFKLTTSYPAISIHKFVITFCVSLELLQTGSTMLVFFSYLVTFSLVSPMGIGLGMMISEMGTIDDLTVAVLQGTTLTPI